MKMTWLAFLCISLLLIFDPAASVPVSDIVSAAASAVSAGASLMGGTVTLLMNDGYRVNCGIDLENWTRFPLTYPQTEVPGGVLEIPPRNILPGRREAMVARKTGYTATGTYGTVSWLVEGKNRRIFIMWSAPFNFDFYSNWLGVGISLPGSTGHQHGDSTFDLMYNGNTGLNGNLGFNRLEFECGTSSVVYKDNDIEVVGSMGCSHHAIVHVIVRPVQGKDQDLAPSIRSMLESK